MKNRSSKAGRRKKDEKASQLTRGTSNRRDNGSNSNYQMAPRNNPGDKVVEGKTTTDSENNEPKVPGDKVKVDDPNN
ncbi:hypothetical protein [Ligilactobacillus salivarius]|uniref:Uncharacterized protein n=1 Tax=Ligilactobacillus salivarius TaxID=1624 RepID=A0A2U2M0K2_9LACO|nr:hypothetical protein [Ligilactobacillus salivarius]PWG50401.1 hypothetical protein DB362_10005 [Ligilactobacillus salivarius]